MLWNLLLGFKDDYFGRKTFEFKALVYNALISWNNVLLAEIMHWLAEIMHWLAEIMYY